MAKAFDPYHAWLGIPAKDQPANHYRLLAIELFESSADVIESAADQRMAHLRTFQTGKNSALSQKLLNEVAAAKICLLNPQKRAAYDAELRTRLATTRESSEDSFGRRMADVLAEVEPGHAARQARSRSSTPLVLGIVALVALVGVGAFWAFRTKKPEPSKPQPVVVATIENPKPVPAPPIEKAPVVAAPKKVEEPAKRVEPQIVAMPPKPVAPPVAVASVPAPQSPTPNPQSPTPSPRPQTPAPQSPTPNPQSLAKQPVPEGPRVDESLKVAREAYQEEYTQAQTAIARGLLAKKILQKGLETTDDAVARFVLIRLARDVALKANDTRLAFEAIDRLGEGFEVDPSALKAEIAVATAKQARKVAEHKAAADQALMVMRQALDADSCTVAQEMARLALVEAGKARDKDVVAQARAGQKQAQQAAKSLEQVEAARAVLKAKPDDPAANLAVGRYECFTKGAWPKGLEHLVRSRDATFSSLASEDLASPKADPRRLKLADAWWDRAQEAEARERDSMLLRAGYWYDQLGAIDEALVRTKVENRLAQIGKLGRAAGGPAPKQMVTNSIGMRFVLVPAGDFLMGATPEENGWVMEEGRKRNEGEWYFDRVRTEVPRHPVRLTHPFYLGIYEVTQGEYEQVMGANPSSFSANGKDSHRVAGQDTSRYPVNGVSWDDAAEFCQRLSSLPKERAARRTYRLPTEAEWEYACRAGSTDKWSFGDDPRGLEEYAWFDSTSKGTTHPVGEKKPNAFGLYDMHGNVCEWCLDRLDHEYYRHSPAADPLGPSVGAGRIMRGGAWAYSPVLCRSAFRSRSGPADRGSAHGFRVVVVR